MTFKFQQFSCFKGLFDFRFDCPAGSHSSCGVPVTNLYFTPTKQPIPVLVIQSTKNLQSKTKKCWTLVWLDKGSRVLGSNTFYMSEFPNKIKKES